MVKDIDQNQNQNRFVEEVEVSGHIIDSLILPKVLDLITQAGGSFELKEMSIGQRRADPSFALITVEADSDERLREILASISDHGAVPTDGQDCRLETADVDGAFPESFYSSTNQRTQVKIAGDWIDVADQEMDCGVLVDTAQDASSTLPLPRCIPMVSVKQGDQIVVGHRGVRVFPEERSTQRHGFEFMNSAVSTEKPKKVAVRQVASEILRCKREGKKVLLVGGPAIIHTGSAGMVASLIRAGLVHRLFAGNALAAHDIEQSLFGTSLGVDIGQGSIVEAGHEHHLRAINRIRRLGSIPRCCKTLKA